MHTVKHISGEDYIACAALISQSMEYAPTTAAQISGTEIIGVFNDRGTICGCAMLMQTGTHAYVDYLLVEIGCRGQGIGDMLVAHIVAHFRNTGIRFVHLCTAADNAILQHMVTSLRPQISGPFVCMVIDLEETKNG